MSFRKKLSVSFLVISLSASLLSSLPIGGQHAGLHKLGFSSAVSAASQVNLDNLYKLHEALDAADSEDVQAVNNLKDEIAGLDDTADHALIDPVWNKISAKLPAYVNQEKVKTDLFRLLKALKIYLLDPQESELEAIRTNTDFKAALQTISAAAGQPSLTINDFLLFLFGDADQLKGVEGTLYDTLHNMDPYSIATHINNKQQAKDLLFQETEKVLALAEKYQVSRVLRNLGVKAQDIKDMQQNFENTLQFDEAAFIATAIAYIRSNSTVTWSNSHITENSPTYRYTLQFFGAYVAPYPDILPTSMTKISGSPYLQVSSSNNTFIGFVTLNNQAVSASAVIQIKLLQPFGTSEKVVLEQEITHGKKEPIFNADSYFEGKNKTLQALELGTPSDIEAVNSIRDEIEALDETAADDLSIVDPIWGKLEGLFPSEEREQAKRTLFLLLKDTTLLHYDPQEADYKRIITNPEYIDLLYKITNLKYEHQVEHLLILLFGEVDPLAGISGSFLSELQYLSISYPISRFYSILYDDEQRKELLHSSIRDTYSSYSYRTYHLLIPHLIRHNITANDLILVYDNFKNKLEHSNEADRALLLAYLRSNVRLSSETSQDGSQQFNTLYMFNYNMDPPLYDLEWSIVSGSSAINVSPNGTVSLSKFVSEASAVIQAAIIDPHNGRSYVLFQKEMTLKNKNGSIIPHHLLNRFNALSSALHAGTPEEVQAVRTLQEEIAAFDNSSLEALMNPVWKKINAKLPAGADKAQLKSSLLQMFKALSSFLLDPQHSQLESIYGNPEYSAIINAIGTAGGNPNLSVNDLFILLFGNGGTAKGIEGAIQEIVFSMNPQEQSALLENPHETRALITEALMNELLHNDSYALIPVLSRLDITPIEVLAALLGFQVQLENDGPAIQALIKAYIRSASS